jgi:hypothetical protein
MRPMAAEAAAAAGAEKLWTPRSLYDRFGSIFAVEAMAGRSFGQVRHRTEGAQPRQQGSLAKRWMAQRGMRSVLT